MRRDRGRAPAISVLMPVYNVAPYLAEAVASILEQTFRDLELIIVDDGSTDDSPAILDGFAAKDTRVHLISRPNTGIVGALNDGLAACQGEFLARMDGDDVSRPRRLERQIAYMQKHPECVCLGTGWRYVRDGRTLPSQPVLTDPGKIRQALFLGRGSVTLHATTMMRRHAVLSVGGYSEHVRNMHEELALFLELIECGEFGNIPEVLFLYRMRSSSNSANAGLTEGGQQAADTLLAEAYSKRGWDYPPDWGREWFRVDPASACRRHLWRAAKSGSLARVLWWGARGVIHQPFAWMNWHSWLSALKRVVLRV